MERLTYFLKRRMTLPFGLPSRASECNNPRRPTRNLVGIACWASFAGWRNAAMDAAAPEAKKLSAAAICHPQFVWDFVELYVGPSLGVGRVAKKQRLSGQ